MLLQREKAYCEVLRVLERLKDNFRDCLAGDDVELIFQLKELKDEVWDGQFVDITTEESIPNKSVVNVGAERPHLHPKSQVII